MLVIKDESYAEVPPTQRGHAIPFERTENIKISQGYNGPYSHFMMKLFGEYKSDKRFCVDFNLAFGTEVRASKRGQVLFVFDSTSSYYEGLDIEIGAKTPVNFISLIHKDGTISLYQHLSKGSAIVKRGEDVRKHQPIARTGKSGWIGGIPHLHHELYSLKKGFKQTFPIIFDNYYGSLEHSVLHPESFS